jgi:hypothetical protein
VPVFEKDAAAPLQRRFSAVSALCLKVATSYVPLIRSTHDSQNLARGIS